MEWLKNIFKRKQVKREKSLPVDSFDWLASDCINLRKFLLSPTGKTLISRARRMEYNRAVENARDTFHSQHSAGVTVGIADTLNWIESLASDELFQKLSLPTDAQPENNTASGDGEAALVEKFSP